VATLGVIDKSKPRVKYKAKNEKEMEAREAKVQKLTNMGKEIVGEELHFNDIGSIWAFFVGESSFLKKKKNKKKGTKAKRKDSLLKEKKMLLDQRKKYKGE
jgi:hypothetical protein